MHYNRSQIEVKDGARLVRPIGRPDYMIKNEEVHELEAIGKVEHFQSIVNREEILFVCFRVILVEFLVLNIVVRMLP